MTTHLFVYLASQSPRRAQLMEQLGVAYKPLAPDRHEDMEALEEERSNEPPNEYVRRVTILKMNAARARLKRRRLPDAPILCADTTVALGKRIFAKPQSEEHAAEMLRALSGRTHRVMTAVAVSVGRQTMLEVSESRVRFAELSERSIGMYVASGEPMGKAGAYAIQSRIAAWIEHIEGSYTGIMGLPLHETTTLLSRARVRLDL